MKVVAFDLESWERDAFRPLEGSHDVVLVGESLDAARAAEHAEVEVLSTFIYSDLSERVLRRLERLRLVATRSTGVDHIPLDYCRERGIAVSNVPTYGAHTVAEHVFALLLAISHRMVEAVDRTRRGDFSSRGLQGFDLRGRTLGVVGTGAIGLETIRIARGFDMKVLAHDPRPNLEAARRLGFEYLTLADLLSRSDVVSLHVPASPATHHMIGRREFDQMREGAVLINTSRGTVVETMALVRALAEQKLSAAGLDVLPDEPVIREEAEVLRSVYEEAHDLRNLLADHVLVRLRNVIVTPHSAFNTREAVRRILEVTVENIEAFARGEPRNVVT